MGCCCLFHLHSWRTHSLKRCPRSPCFVSLSVLRVSDSTRSSFGRSQLQLMSWIYWMRSFWIKTVISKINNYNFNRIKFNLISQFKLITGEGALLIRSEITSFTFLLMLSLSSIHDSFLIKLSMNSYRVRWELSPNTPSRNSSLMSSISSSLIWSIGSSVSLVDLYFSFASRFIIIGQARLIKSVIASASSSWNAEMVSPKFDYITL